MIGTSTERSWNGNALPDYVKSQNIGTLKRNIFQLKGGKNGFCILGHLKQM